MFVWTVARSSAICDDDASRRASTAALAWSVGQLPAVMVERERGGGGKDADLPHRAAEDAPVAQGMRR